MTHRINMRSFRTGLRLFALMLLAVGILFNASSSSFITANAVDTVTEPQWDSQGSIKLNKTATKIDGSNDEWRIDLSIDGKDYKTTTDIVLVIDISNSMSYSMSGNGMAIKGRQRLDYTKIAAKSFVSDIIGRNTNGENRIAIVSFKSYARKVLDFSTDKDELYSGIDRLTVPYDNSGGTNMQAGLNEAKKLLDKSQAQNKTIVILGDGAPTHCYKIETISGVTVEHTNGYKHNLSYDIDNVQMTFDENSISWGMDIECPKCKEDLNREYVNIESTALPTEYEAKAIKTDGVNIYSVALGADSTGVKTLKNISNTGGGAFFTEIPPTTTESTVQQVLNSTFESIAASISAAAKDGYVIDPMGEMFDLVSDASEIKTSQGSIEISEDKRQIKWNVGTVKEGTTAHLSYIVRIKATAESGQAYPTNKETVFYYKNYLGKDSTKNFPIPMASISYGFIDVVCYLSDNSGNPLGSDGQAVEDLSQALILKRYDYVGDNGNKLPLESSYTVFAPDDIKNTTFVGSYADKPPIISQNKISVSLTADSPKHTVYFAYSMNNGSLVLTKTGDLLKDESSIFKIEGSDGSVTYETIQGTGSRTFKNLTVGVSYTVTELTDWSWKYELNSENQQTVCISPSTAVTVSFENKGSTNWLTDESFASNIFDRKTVQ